MPSTIYFDFAELKIEDEEINAQLKTINTPDAHQPAPPRKGQCLITPKLTFEPSSLALALEVR